MGTAEQQQPPTREVRRSDEYVPPGPDDADQGPIPAEADQGPIPAGGPGADSATPGEGST